MRTIVSETSLPPNPHQDYTPDHAASTFSYTIGPLDPSQLITIHAPLSDGNACTLLTPLRLPRPILDAPAFQDGYEYNYLSEEGHEEEEWMGSVPRVVNHIYSNLTDTCYYRDLETGEVLSDFLPWQVGWLLRDLTRLAKTDWMLASVGIGHLCFLLPLLTQDRPANWPRSEPYHAGLLHRRVVKAYRAHMRLYREQSKSFAEAQQLALAGRTQEAAGGSH